MRIYDYSKRAGISEDECREAIRNEALIESLEGHVIDLPRGEIELDEDAVFILDRYFQMRTSSSASSLNSDNKALPQKTQKILYIAIVIVIFLYYLAAIILEAIGVIGKLGMILIILPVVLGVIIAYVINRNKKNSEGKL